MYRPLLLLALLFALCAAACGTNHEILPHDNGGPSWTPDADGGAGGPTFIAHYHSAWTDTFVHYDDGGGWTTPPGEKMAAEGDGWFRYEGGTFTGQGLMLVFNDGADSWDNNNEANYTTKLREFWIAGGMVYAKKPTLSGPPVDAWCKGVTCGKGMCNEDEDRCDCDQGYLFSASQKTCVADACANVDCKFGELCDPSNGQCLAACTPDVTSGDFQFCTQTTESSLVAIIKYQGADKLDLKKSELRLNENALAASDYQFDEASQTLALSAQGLEASKYSYLLRLKTQSGANVRALFLPMWIGKGMRYAEFGWRDAIMYQIMTDRFSNGDMSNDIDNTKGTLAEVDDVRSQWQGGDFRGITDKIKDGYFTAMGINALWISSPLLNSHNSQPAVQLSDTRRFSSYHSYHPIVTGYTNLDHLGYDNPIETAFGTSDELHELVHEAHVRGIRVIPDFVANHVQKEAALYAKHPDWFTAYNPCDGNWDAHRIDCWFTTDMPDFDYTKQDPIHKVVDHAIWMIEEYNFDGFRADALKHMTDDFVKALKAAVVEQVETTVKDHSKSDEAAVFYMVGESLGGWARYHVRPDMVQGQVDEAYYNQAKAALLNYQASLKVLAAFAIPNDTAYLTSQPIFGAAGGYPGAVMGNFFGNHDQVRALTEASGDYARLRLAQTFLFTSPGNIPMLYQGDDIGTLGQADPDNRKMQRFDGLVDAEVASLNNARKVGTLREAHAALRRGKRETVVIEDYFWVYKASYQDDVVYVALNRDADKQYTPPAGYTDALGNCSGGTVKTQSSCIFVKQ